MIRGRDLLAVARTLTGNEARYRSAVNRAYYAAFSEADAYVRRHGYTRTGSAAHDRVWNYLRHHVPDSDTQRAAARRAAADQGFQLKGRRQKSDYALHQTVSSRERRAAIADSEAIIKALDGLTSGSTEPRRRFSRSRQRSALDRRGRFVA
jgi:uncharacterized protein (UPF0332 family)